MTSQRIDCPHSIKEAPCPKLIAEIEAVAPTDEYYDAKVTVLSEMIKRHVKEEEQPL